jgi:hypothetical protein
MRFTKLTETVSPLFGLYNQGFDVYYRADLYDRLLNPVSGGDTAVSVPTSSGAAKAAR